MSQTRTYTYMHADLYSNSLSTNPNLSTVHLTTVPIVKAEWHCMYSELPLKSK